MLAVPPKRSDADDESSTESLMIPRRPWRPLVTASAGVGAAVGVAGAAGAAAGGGVGAATAGAA